MVFPELSRKILPSAFRRKPADSQTPEVDLHEPLRLPEQPAYDRILPQSPKPSAEASAHYLAAQQMIDEIERLRGEAHGNIMRAAELGHYGAIDFAKHALAERMAPAPTIGFEKADLGARLHGFCTRN